MLTRSVRLVFLLAVGAIAGARAQLPEHFGVTGPITATGGSFVATYYGWEATTVYGHEVYALTVSQYGDDLSRGCFSFYAVFRTGCDGVGDAGLLGVAMFGKPYAGECPNPNPCAVNPYFGSPFTTPVIPWAAGTEIVLALMVNQGNQEYNWFFSGDPSRNGDHDAHIGFFPGTGVPGNKGIGIMPQTVGLTVFGFEDVIYQNSDWDFDNSIFGINTESIGIPQAITPEPATLTLLGGGLAGLGVLAGRRRGRRKTSAA